jgi:SAM-dependent methyltransferase
MTDTARAFWNSEAATFDDEPDHGLADPETRAAWRRLLLEHLPPAPADVADLGSGTGTLSLLLAAEGYRVQGLDLAEEMVAAATRKAEAAGTPVTFRQGDASTPPYPPGTLDVVLSRHVLWAMPDRSGAVRAWTDLLRPGGRLLLVEGHWFTGGGLTAAACEGLLREHRDSVDVRRLDDAVYWGREIDDERYLAVSTH